MRPEINIISILALERRIEEGLGDAIQLKRTRNSLLNVSTHVPPELLGQVFSWNVIPERLFGEPEMGSYNFLLVCHHWFEVAYKTPELWTHWCGSLKRWAQCYQRSRSSPIYLTLRTCPRTDRENAIPFDGPLRDALRDRVACDSIRSICLQGGGTVLLRSVISSLTADGEDIRDSSIEGLRVEYTDLDISTYLSRYRFPKLRTLRLITAARISPWDRLKLQAPSLTSLSLDVTMATDSPTTSQLLSILASYPNLQKLSLNDVMIPHDTGDRSTSRVSLGYLKKLRLIGGCSDIFRLLGLLEHPDTLTSVYLDLWECGGDVTSEFLVPYLRNRIQRDDGFQSRLGIQISSRSMSISFGINAFGDFNIPTFRPGHGYPSVSLLAELRDRIPRGARGTLCADLIAPVPRESVVDFTVGLDAHITRDLLVAMPNIENLYLNGLVDFDTFLQPAPLSGTRFLPSLKHLCLEYATLKNDDWKPLIAYITHQTSGGHTVSLRLHGGRHPVPPEVAREIEGLVDEFIIS